MKKFFSIVFLLLLLITSVNAETYNFELEENNVYNGETVGVGNTYYEARNFKALRFIDSQNLYGNKITSIIWQIPGNHGSKNSDHTTCYIGDFIKGEIGYFRFTSQDMPYTQYYINNIEYIKDYPTGMSGLVTYIIGTDNAFTFPSVSNTKPYGTSTNSNFGIAFISPEGWYSAEGVCHFTFEDDWNQELQINTNDFDIINLIRHNTVSKLLISGIDKEYGDTSITDFRLVIPSSERPYTIEITNLNSNKQYIYDINKNGEIGEDIPEEYNVLNRTGTLQIQDYNGTKIEGFTAHFQNYKTHEWYNFTSSTDVVTVTVPMDSQTRIRHPETGEYIETPVGYYNVLVSKSGYEQSSEGFIKISVLPVEYAPYALGTIYMKPVDMPLHGRHKFQLLSATDWSMLSSGTISCKSATTGEWYNTSFSGGLAEIILSYDTSDVNYPVCGNYFVYATSPGYIDVTEPIRVNVRPTTTNDIHKIILMPIGGIPHPDNITLHLNIYDGKSGYPIPETEIHVNAKYGTGYPFWANFVTSSSGYIELELPGNTTYEIISRSPGFTDTRTTIELTTKTPEFLEIKMCGGIVPTPTNPEPPETSVTFPTPTIPGVEPILTLPTGETASDYLEYFAGHFGMILGGGIEIGKLFMWLVFSLVIGVYVSQSSGSGAQGFGIGAGVVSLFFTIIGWIPIWIVVLLILIIGLLYGKSINNDTYKR